MPEEVLFRSESPRSREAIASFLRRVADNLEAGEAVTLRSGDDSVTLRPGENPTFEVKAEREGPAGGPGELSIELEIEWDEADGGDGGDLVIE